MVAIGKPNRDVTWDIVKALCIILMVLGHCYATIDNCVGNFIYLFHMGVFFFISGYFLKREEQSPIRHSLQFILRKVRSIYLPYIGFNLLFLLFHNVFYSWHITPEHYASADFVECAWKILTLNGYVESPLMVPSWFLRTLFFSVILAHLIVNYIPKIWLQALVVAGIYSFAYLADRNIFNMQREMIVLSTIWLGYLTKKQQLIHSDIVRWVPFLLVLLLLIGLSFCIKINVNIREYSYFGMYPLCTLLGCYFCYCLASVLKQSPACSKALCHIGQSTMSIMLFSCSFMYLVSWILIWLYGRPLEDLQYAHTPIEQQYTFWVILYLLMGVGGPICLNYLYLKARKSISASKL